MASPREIQDNHDRAEVMAAIAKDKDNPPHGFIRVHGRPMAVWLPDGPDHRPTLAEIEAAWRR